MKWKIIGKYDKDILMLQILPIAGKIKKILLLWFNYSAKNHIKTTKEMIKMYENESKDNHFTWIPFYEEFAQKLLLYKDKRKELTRIVYKLKPEYINYLKWKPENSNGSDNPEIDPFSIFGIFNRGIKKSNRLDIIEYFKHAFKISSDIPIDFDSIPILNNQRSFFINSNSPSFSKDIEVLWTMFESALSNNKLNLSTSFDEATKCNGWGEAMLTMALYWIAPNSFLALDSKNKDFLKKK